MIIGSHRLHAFFGDVHVVHFLVFYVVCLLVSFFFIIFLHGVVGLCTTWRGSKTDEHRTDPSFSIFSGYKL